MSGPALILASASPRRSDLLKSLGIDFRVVPSSAEEVHDERLPMEALCRQNAEAKAREVASRFAEELVVGADTLVGLNGRAFGKPIDLEDAARILRELSGQTHQVITGVCLVRGARADCFSDTTRVTFHRLSDAVIAEYLRTVPVFDKAGAYGIQERGELLVARIEGSFTNVVGFPTEKFLERYRAFGAD